LCLFIFSSRSANDSYNLVNDSYNLGADDWTGMTGYDSRNNTLDGSRNPWEIRSPTEAEVAEDYDDDMATATINSRQTRNRYNSSTFQPCQLKTK
jgi:hypothetical protein